jgi:signal transduction histidine kinase
MKLPTYPEATFLSEVTASATHELRNVLAIIKESNGLMGDMVQLCAVRGVLDEARVSRAVDRVDTQVKRGADILTGLNRLSHCLDVDRGPLDLEEEVDLLVFMSGRKARNRRHTLAVTAREGPAPVTTSPLHLQMALFAVLKLCIEGFPDGSAISVGVKRSAQGAAVEFVVDPASVPGTADHSEQELWDSASLLVEAIEARMEAFADGRGIRVVFALPG